MTNFNLLSIYCVPGTVLLNDTCHLLITLCASSSARESEPLWTAWVEGLIQWCTGTGSHRLLKTLVCLCSQLRAQGLHDGSSKTGSIYSIEISKGYRSGFPWGAGLLYNCGRSWGSQSLEEEIGGSELGEKSEKTCAPSCQRQQRASPWRGPWEAVASVQLLPL